MPVALEAQELLTWFPRDSHDAPYTPADIPMAGRVFSMILSLVTLCVISVCLTRRMQNIHRWSTLPLGAWYIVLIYVDSFLFVFITAVFKDIGLNETMTICRGAILLCLTLYLSTKVCVYLFLVEKAYIVRGSNNPRYKDKLYMFNICAAMGPYGVLAILNIIWRFSRVENGMCIIGMEKKAMLPLIVFDVGINVYLTTLFIVPLRQLYSYKNGGNDILHTMAVRSFFGSCMTLTSSVANLTVLMVLDGEPAWICFLSCNVEILFSVLTLHWVTSRDRTGQTTNRSYSRSNPIPDAETPNHGSSSRSRNASHQKSKIGTETLISEHYHAQTAGSAPWPTGDGSSEEDLAVFGSKRKNTNGAAWPDDTRAVINASCARADPASEAERGGIALDAIVVTKESEVRREERVAAGPGIGVGRRMGAGRRRSVGGDAESDTTAGSVAVSRGREGSTDGIVGPPSGPVHMV